MEKIATTAIYRLMSPAEAIAHSEAFCKAREGNALGHACCRLDQCYDACEQIGGLFIVFVIVPQVPSLR